MRGCIWAAVLAVVLCGIAVGPAAGNLTERVSVGSGGEEGNNHSWIGGISADGRYIVFRSAASNLVPEDGTGEADVFVRDRLTGATELVSVNDAGEQGNAYSVGGSISADGRYVVFVSYATNFLDVDANGYGPDLFVRDRIAGVTELVGVSGTGKQPNGDLGDYAISADGRYVAFESEATNLVPGATSGIRPIYLRDRLEGTTELVSVSLTAGEADYCCFAPSISADGRCVAFYTAALNLVPGETGPELCDIFVRDRQSATTEKVSVNSLGEPANRGSLCTAITPDGRYVAFKSYATNLAPGVVAEGCREVFVRDRVAGTTEIASVNNSGVQSMGEAISVSISADARYVAFASDGYNLGASFSEWQVFVHDRSAGITGCASLSSDGARADWGAEARLSADGRYVAFESGAENLVADDTNGFQDVFVRDLLGRFPDVPTFHWAYYYVEACAAAGVVAGYWDDTYRPNNTVTRDQMAVFISRAMAGSDALVPTGPATPAFPDVPTSHWAFRHVEYCYDQGVVSGYWDGYHPDEVVNRAQMAVFVARAMAGGEANVPDDPDQTAFFTDVPETHWACKYVEYCHDQGVVSGYWDGYHPDESVTRAQMAVYVQRAFDLPI